MQGAPVDARRTYTPLRIVHVVPSYLPAIRYGGPIYSVHGLCKALVRLGHNVQVLTTSIDGDRDSAVPLERPVDLDGVQVTYFRSPFLRHLSYAPSMSSGLHKVLKDASILHLHSVFLWPTMEAARIARQCGVPYFVSPRGMLVPELIRKKSRLIKTAWLQLFEARNLAGASRLHVTSLGEYTEAQKLRLPMPRACVVPNGFDSPHVGESSAGTAEEPYALFLGRINWKKGIDRAIDAIEGTTMRLIIAGNDEEGLRPKLEQRIADKRLPDRIRFVGSVSGDEKWALLRGARFLVLPSYNENFGNVVLEALAMLCPVIVTPEVGAAEVVLRSGGGIVVSGEPSELRRAMLRLWNDEQTRAVMGQSGCEYVKDHLSWDAVAAEMLQCYRDVIPRISSSGG
jgi:glycosyltransferase involved in cell wall biosynthesis